MSSNLDSRWDQFQISGTWPIHPVEKARNLEVWLRRAEFCGWSMDFSQNVKGKGSVSNLQPSHNYCRPDFRIRVRVR